MTAHSTVSAKKPFPSSRRSISTRAGNGFWKTAPSTKASCTNRSGDLVETLTERFAAAGLGLRGDRKKSLFRINRDVRFAKDKRPYNSHLSAILSPDGTKMEQGVFFVYIGLDRCFAGVAWWQPGPALLLAMRKAIATRPAEFRALIAALKKNRPRTRYGRLHEAHAARFRACHRGRSCGRQSATVISPSGTRSIRRESTARHWSTNLSISPCGQSRCSTGAGRSRARPRRQSPTRRRDDHFR